MKQKITLFIALIVLLASLIITIQPTKVKAVNSPYPDDNWWIAGGISSTNVVAAYQPMGAINLSNSFR